MDEAAEWRALAASFAEFRKLERNRLLASWFPPAWNYPVPWIISGTDDEPYISDRFQELAERGAVLLGQPPGPSAAFYWLDVLRAESPRYRIIRLTSGKPDGTPEPDQGGVVVELCAASEQQCYRLETRAIAHEQKINRMLNPLSALGLPEPSIPNQPAGFTPPENKKTRSDRPQEESVALAVRSSGKIHSPVAAMRMREFIEVNGLTQPVFAKRAKTTDRTIRSFGKTGKVRKDIFRQIAEAMNTTPEKLLTPD
jgi:hypothetical protein